MGSVCDLDRALHAFGQTTGRCQCGVMVLHYQAPAVPVAALRALLDQWRVSNILTAGDAIRYLCADQLATLCDQEEKQP